jgi:dihydrofolate reductase
MRLTLIAAQSVDGFITRHDEPGTAFASPADQAHFRRALTHFDCSVFGATTYRVARDQIRAGLSHGRRRVVLTRQPAAYASDAVPGALEFTDDAPEAIIDRLRQLGHREGALLGGAEIHDLFLHARLVDELWLTIEPRIFGAGTPLVRKRVDLSLELLEADRLDDSDSLLVKYRVRRPAG